MLWNFKGVKILRQVVRRKQYDHCLHSMSYWHHA
jgi:hypothetical protein